MPSAGFNIRLSASNVDAVRKALESVGKSGEGALKQIERSARVSNSQGLQAFNAGLRDVQVGMQGAVSRLGPLGGALSALGPAGLAAGAALAVVTAGATALFSAVIDNAKVLEGLEARLKTVTGSTELAAQAFDQIKDFAKTTPFEVTNLVTAFTRLKAAGIDPTEERLRAFGDTAAAFGKDITEFADAVVGALTGEGERLKQFGIIARFESDQVRFSFRGATREVNRDAESIVAALQDIGETSFAGGMEEQAKTLEGVISNLADAWSSLLDTIDETSGISQTYKDIARAITEEFGEAEGVIRRLDETSREALIFRRAQLIEQLNRPADAAQARADDLANLNPTARELGFGQRMVEEDLALLQQETEETKALREELRQVNAELRVKNEQDFRRAELAAEAADAEKEALRLAKEAEAAAKAKEDAEEAAEKAAKKAATERERALAKIVALEEEAARAGLEGIELLKVQRDQELDDYQALLDNKTIKEEEFAQARLAIEEKYQREKAEIEKDAAEKAARERQQELDKAARKAEQEAEKARREAEREAERQAELMQEPFKNAIEGIQDSFTDAFENIFSGGVDSFSDLADTAKRIFVRLAAELATLQLFQGGAFGFGGFGAAPAGLGGGVGTAQPTSGAFNFGSLLSGVRPTAGGGGPFDILSYFRSPTGGGRAGGVGTPGVGGGFYSAPGFNLGGFLGGAGLGFGAGSLLNSLVGGQSTGGAIGSGIGSLAGAALGSFIPGIGTILGGLGGGALGGLIGGLFGPGKSVGPNSFGRFGLQDGRLTVTGTGADNGGDAAAAGQLAEAVAAQVNAILEGLGAGFARGPITYVGSFGSNLGVRSGGYNGGRFDRYFGNDPQALVEGATLQAFAKGDLTGVSAELESAIRQAAKIADDLEDFSAYIGVASAILDESLFDSEELTAAEQALKDLNAQFEEAAERAEKLGLSVAKLEELRDQAIADLTEGFDEGIRLQILGLTDPIAAALESQAKVAEERLKEAEALGADLVEVERLNALERQRVLEQAGGDLKRFFEEITFGALSGASPGASVEAQRAAFEAAAAQGNVGEITRLGRGLLESARGAYASGPLYQEILGRVQQVVGGYVAGNDNTSVAATLNEGFGQSITLYHQMLAELSGMRQELTALRQDNARLTSQLEALAA